MTKERGPLDYLSDWGKPSSPKGSEETGVSGGDYEYGNPNRAPMGETPEWGLNKDGMTSYGHSDDVKEVNLAKDKDLLRDGYERGEADGEGSVLGTRQPDGTSRSLCPARTPMTPATALVSSPSWRRATTAATMVPAPLRASS